MTRRRRNVILTALLLCFAACKTHIQCAEPLDGSQLSVVAFGSCAHQDKPQPIWKAVIDKRPDLFLFLGDNVYADSMDPKTIRAAYQKLEQNSGYRQLRDMCAILATWDDHDYGVNDSDSEHPQKKESQRAFLDFFRIPETSHLRSQEGVYQSQVFGPVGRRVQVIMLDCRYHRGRFASVTIAGRRIYVPTEDPQISMLGTRQWEWLTQQLRQAAELHLVVSSIQVLPKDHPFEKWQNLPRQRGRLLKLLRNASGAVLILSGDQHLGEVSKSAFEGFDFWELTSSGLTHHRGSLAAPNRARIGEALLAENFGLVEIDWEEKDPLVSMSICDVHGEPHIKKRRRLSELTPRE